MTWITDDSGSRWVETPERKRRKPARALRFADVKVGDQLMCKHKSCGRVDTIVVWYYLVTDLWFDPVAGQDDETAGRMVAIQLLNPRTGEVVQRKHPHTVRGLASQGYRYADIDFIAHMATVRAALQEGDVVGIGMGHVIRRRPKIPGPRSL